MTKPNPFSKLPGGAQAPKPDIEKRMTHDDPPEGALCPFMGGVPVPMVDPEAQSAIIKNPHAQVNPLDLIQTGVAFQACQRASCMLWNKEKQTCQMKLAAEAQVAQVPVMERLAVVLEGLGQRFGF